MSISNPEKLTSLKVVYDEVDELKANGLAKVQLTVSKVARFGFINQSTTVIVPIIYESVCLHDSNGFAKVKRNNLWGFVNLMGEEIIPPIYDATEFFREDLVKVCLHSKWGFVDSNGKVIIPLQYDWVWQFSEGLAIVRIGDKYGAYQ